jgi:hypothetical protein
MAEKPKSKSKHRLKFRFSIVFLSFLLSFMLCFIAYVNALDNAQASASPVINNNVSDSVSVSVSVSETDDEASLSDDTVSDSEYTGDNSSQEDDTQSVSVTDEIIEEQSENSSDTETQPSEDSQDSTADISNPVAESERKDDSYLSECVFVGDSISTGISGYGFVSEKNVFAQTSMRIDLINNTPLDTFYGNVLVTEAIKSANPSNVYIMLGSNGMGWIDISKMMSDYSTFIDSVKDSAPDADIYVMSIPPVTAEREEKPSVEEGKILNSDINNYNSQLLDLANEKNIYYIDTHSALMGSDGKLPSDVSKDGMHFNKDTYIKMIEYILTHVAG